MKRTATTTRRHAADLTFLYRQAAFAAKHAEETAQDPKARDLARRLKEASFQLRQRARELEELAS